MSFIALNLSFTRTRLHAKHLRKCDMSQTCWPLPHCRNEKNSQCNPHPIPLGARLNLYIRKLSLVAFPYIAQSQSSKIHETPNKHQSHIGRHLNQVCHK